MITLSIIKLRSSIFGRGVLDSTHVKFDVWNDVALWSLYPIEEVEFYIASTAIKIVDLNCFKSRTYHVQIRSITYSVLQLSHLNLSKNTNFINNTIGQEPRHLWNGMTNWACLNFDLHNLVRLRFTGILVGEEDMLISVTAYFQEFRTLVCKISREFLVCYVFMRSYVEVTSVHWIPAVFPRPSFQKP